MTPAETLVFVGGWGYEADALAGLRDCLRGRVRTRVLSPGALHRSGSGSGAERFASGLRNWMVRCPAPVALAGWSLGGQVALAFAARHPDRVTRLSLVASTPRFVQGSGNPPGVPFSEIRALRLALRRKPEQTLAAFRKRASSPGQISQAWAKPATDVLLHGLDALQSFDLRAELAALPIPVALLHGDGDAVIPFSSSVWMRKHAQAATLVKVPEAGHDLPVSAPERVAEFLAKHI